MLKLILHYTSCTASFILVWCILYWAGMYVFNGIPRTHDCWTPRIIVGLLAAAFIWRFFTFTSPYC